MNVEDLVCFRLRLNRILKNSFFLYLFSLKGFLPLVHESLVFFVHIVFMVHSLDAAFVKDFEVFTKGSYFKGSKCSLPQNVYAWLKELYALLKLAQFKHI